MIGQIAGSTLGGLFGQFFGWRGIFVVFGIVSLGVAGVLMRQAARFAEHPAGVRPLGASILTVPAGGTLIFVGLLGAFPTPLSGALQALGASLLVYALMTQYGGMLRRRTAPLVLGTVMVEGLFVFGGLAYLASSLTDRFGLNYAFAGLLVAGFGLGGLVYSISVKKLVGRIGELGVLLLGGTLLGAAFVSIGLMPSWPWFVPAVVLLGMGYYTMHGTLQTRATELAPEARGTAISLFAFFFFMGQATGPQLLGSVVRTHGYGAAFITAGIGLATLAALSRMLFARAGRRGAG
jgi:YNFM family putative membrane transporter